MASEKLTLHPRNKNRDPYDLHSLVEVIPELKAYVQVNKYNRESIDFSNPVAVKLLNQAILHHYYGINYWVFPEGNLCPPIPGRADYIHYIADLLADQSGDKITCLDIGVGANCIYPIIGVTEYDWNFIATDIDVKSIKSARNIINKNPSLRGKVGCRLQENKTSIFNGVINLDDQIDVSICNPPFHRSAKEALKGSQRKTRNLSGKKGGKTTLNFSGVSNELFCEGGELQFIQTMIEESQAYAKNCRWFTTLVSKESHLAILEQALGKVDAKTIKIIPMGTGNKSSRVLAWSFRNQEERRSI